MAFYKNKGQKWPFMLVDDSGDPVTGEAANITAQVSKDGGALAATNDTNPTELGTSGLYLFDGTANENNADFVFVLPAHATNKFDPPFLLIFTTPGDNTGIDAKVQDGGYVDGFVHLDGAIGDTADNGATGTIESPFDNWVDAVAAANARGVKRLRLLQPRYASGGGNLPVVASVNLSQFLIDLNHSTIIMGSSVTTGDTTWIGHGSVRCISSPFFPLASSDRTQDVTFYGTQVVTAVNGSKQERSGLLSISFSNNSALNIWPECGTYAPLVNTCQFNFNGHNVHLALPKWYGNLTLNTMTDSNAVLEVYGYGKLTIQDDCTDGTIRVTSHVKVFAQDGSAWVNGVDKPAVEVVSEPGGVSSFSGDAATQIDAIEDSIEDVVGTQFDPAFPVELTIKKTGGVIVPEADVWATAEGTTTPILKSGEAGPDGVVTLSLGEGRYDIHRDKEGVNFGDPITIEVESDGSYALG